jgi:hypothetical protein
LVPEFLLTPSDAGDLNDSFVYCERESSTLQHFSSLSRASLKMYDNENMAPVSNTAQLMKYMKLDQKGTAMAEYIWIDSTGGVRSKSKVSHKLFYSTLHFYRYRPSIATLGLSHRTWSKAR